MEKLNQDYHDFIKKIKQLLSSNQQHQVQVQKAIQLLQNRELKFDNIKIISDIYKGLALYLHPDKYPVHERDQVTKLMTILNNIKDDYNLFQAVIKQIQAPAQPQPRGNFYREQHDFAKNFNRQANHFNYDGQQFHHPRNQSDSNTKISESVALDKILYCEIDLDVLKETLQYRYTSKPIPSYLDRLYQTRIAQYEQLKRELATHSSQDVQTRLQELAITKKKLQNIYQQAGSKPAGNKYGQGKPAGAQANNAKPQDPSKSSNFQRQQYPKNPFDYAPKKPEYFGGRTRAKENELKNILTTIQQMQKMYSSLISGSNSAKIIAQIFSEKHAVVSEQYRNWLHLNQTSLNKNLDINNMIKKINTGLQKNRVLSNHLSILTEIENIKNINSYGDKDDKKKLEEYDKFFNKLDTFYLGDSDDFADLKVAIKNGINLIKNNKVELLTKINNPFKYHNKELPKNFQREIHTNRATNEYCDQYMQLQKMQQVLKKIPSLANKFYYPLNNKSHNDNFYDFIVNYNNIVREYNLLYSELRSNKKSFQKFNTEYDQLVKKIEELYKFLKHSIPNYNSQGWLKQEQMNQAKLYFAANPAQVKYSRKESGLPYSIIKGVEGKLYAIYNSKSTYNGINGLLGKGSYGRVKLAQCLDDNTIVVAKVQTPPSTSFEQNIAYEEDVLNCMQEYLGKAQRQITSKQSSIKTKHYTFSKFVEGKSLTDYFKDNKYLERDKKLNIILKALEATKKLHSKGVIHGDLSFNNILYDSNKDKVTIIDFGFAQKFNKSLPQDSLVPFRLIFEKGGSYYPPEIVTKINYRTRRITEPGRIGYKSDVYNLGKWIEWFTPNDSRLQQLSARMTINDINSRADLDSCIQEVKQLILASNNYQHRGGLGRM